MADEKDSSAFCEVQREEFDAIHWRRLGNAAGPPPKRPDDLFGIVLSGGGLRSATFCLGALQALHACGLVTRADYLSTVSGGGYIGAGMIAGMARNGGTFPYAVPSKTPGSSDYRDSEAVSRLRDNGHYIAPNGTLGLLIPLAVLVRGWVVNAAIVFAVLLPLVTLTILANPTSDHLGRSVLYDLAQGLGWEDAAAWLTGSYLLTKALLVAEILFFLSWALVRSGWEEKAMKNPAKRLPIAVDTEVDGRGMRIATAALLALVIVTLIESQDFVLRFLIRTFLRDGAANIEFGAAGLTISAFVGVVATIRKRLAGWIEKAFKQPGFVAWARALFARALLVLAALLLPLLLYGIYLVLCLWGIQIVSHVSPHIVSRPFGSFYPLAPLVLQHYPHVIAAILTVSVIPPLIVFLRDMPPGKVKKLWSWRWTGIALIVLLAFVAAVACATWDPSTLYTRWIFIAGAATALLMTAAFTENANALHRFYKERLAAGFDLMKGAGPPAFMPMEDPRLLAQPYLLVNATLNVKRQSPPSMAPTAKGPGATPLDPAKRGRNADFFLFSPHYVGSEVTGYTKTEAYAAKEPALDLPGAVAISGAAVSSSMGRIGIGLLGPTLALLNLRLGCWLVNPKIVNSPRDTAWEDFLRPYLFQEAFGRLGGDASRIYVTDGGHIDNIGLYQLLKRRCAFIVVIDGEADPALHFSALADVERFARIDLGCRIEIDTRPVQATVAKPAADGCTPLPAPDNSLGGHAAIGRIDYGPDHPDGVLLYIKATTTGDEPSYVLDYKRRYPTFPHETTGDQFFSEEQMEAYRALGFHSVKRVFTPCRQPRDMAARAAWVRLKTMTDKLKATKF